jgi:hypothetical protein
MTQVSSEAVVCFSLNARGQKPHEMRYLFEYLNMVLRGFLDSAWFLKKNDRKSQYMLN